VVTIKTKLKQFQKKHFQNCFIICIFTNILVRIHEAIRCSRSSTTSFVNTANKW